MNKNDILQVLKNSAHIMVIKFRYMGDSIWMLPFADNLKRNLPHIKLSIVVNEGAESCFYTTPSVDRVIPFPRKEIKKPAGALKFLSFIRQIRRLKPDVIIELTDADRPAIVGFLSGAKIRIGYSNENSWRKRLFTYIVQSKIYSKHMVDYHLDMLRELGMKIYDDSIKIPIDDKIFQSLKEKMPTVFDGSEKRKILVHPGARNHLRQWGTKKFAYICDALSDHYRVILVAGHNEGAILNEVVNYMKTKPEIYSNNLTFYEFAALCELSDMFIGNDSGPIHIASAKTFVVGIYGPTLPESISPWTKRRLIFSDKNSLPCRPCMQEKCNNTITQECFKGINPKDVAEKIRGVLRTL